MKQVYVENGKKYERLFELCPEGRLLFEQVRELGEVVEPAKPKSKAKVKAKTKAKTKAKAKSSSS
jgi:hypothetical protein